MDRLIELISLYADVFEMEGFVPPANEHLHTLLTNPAISFLVALHDHKVVGGLTAYDLPSVYGPAAETYVYDLAVATAFQRQGVGAALLEKMRSVCECAGKREFFLQADVDDTHALSFYRATGGVEEDVRHFSYCTDSRAAHETRDEPEKR